MSRNSLLTPESNARRLHRQIFFLPSRDAERERATRASPMPRRYATARVRARATPFPLVACRRQKARASTFASSPACFHVTKENQYIDLQARRALIVCIVEKMRCAHARKASFACRTHCVFRDAIFRRSSAPAIGIMRVDDPLRAFCRSLAHDVDARWTRESARRHLNAQLTALR